MGKKVIVAGGGHGGIAAAAILARNGFDVTVYERNREDSMGYDWTDIFDRKGLLMAGMDLPDDSLYKLKNDMTFYSPTLNYGVKQCTPVEQLEIQMERRDIYAHIIKHAVENGVKFQYETNILSPIMLGSRVVGINTDRGSCYADLVIDAAGADSPVRSNLPDYLGIEKTTKKFDKFYVYRAFYERTDEIPEDNFKVMLLPNGALGINWVAIEEEHTDVLIGRFEPFDEAYVEKELAFLRTATTALGEKRVRGGQFVTIPVRQSLPIMVADGYAAVGDAAFMTVPLIGSGIANALKAARYLADAVSEDITGAFTAATLYKYQVNYFKNLGAGLAPIACVKGMLSEITIGELEYLFSSGIVDSELITITADTTDLISMAKGLNFKSLPDKVKNVVADKALLKKLAKTGSKIATAASVCAAMPKVYNEKALKLWAAAYRKVFAV